MALGTSLLLLAVGAVLRFAVTVSTSGFNLHTVGVILMIVGGVGVLFSLLWMTMWGDRLRTDRYGRQATYVERDAPPAEPF
jgi:hypothetical protein